MLLRSLQRHRGEVGKCQCDNCVTIQTLASRSYKLGQKSPRRNLNSHAPATCSRDCIKSCILICFHKLNSILLLLNLWVTARGFLRSPWSSLVTPGQRWPGVASPGPDDLWRCLYWGRKRDREELRKNEKRTLAWTLRHKKPGKIIDSWKHWKNITFHFINKI